MNKYLFILILNITFTTQNHDDIILIPHSHDDLGWNWTVMQYYNDRVRNIFNTVIESLLQNSKRKFVYSEVGYLKIYLNEDLNTREEKMNKIKQLIKNGQWEFVNGGISQSDEACPYYEDIMENYFYGLNYLKQNFQSTSVAGWQIDPFGHSYSFAYFVKLFGMDHLVINRIPQDIRNDLERNLDNKMILHWKFPNTSILTHFSMNHYSSPEGMDCDEDCDFSKFDRFKTDIFFAQRSMSFQFAQWYLHGNDFNYTKAQNKFEFTEKVMEQYDHLKYGLFTDYLQSVDQSQINGDYQTDFMVYQEGNNDAWSGYYTTKPDLKRRIRMLGRMLRNFKILVSQNILNKDSNKELLKEVVNISEDFGVFLHHDCITGTAKRYVDDDYFSMMDNLEKRMIDVVHQLQSSLGEINYTNEYSDLLGKQQSHYKKLTKGQKLILHIFNGHVQEKNGLLEFVFPQQEDVNLVINKYDDDQKSLTQIDYEIQYCYKQQCKYIIKDLVQGFNMNVYQLTVEDKKQTQKPIANNDKFLGYSVVLKDNYLLLYNNNNEIIFQLALWKIGAGKSGAYILKYEGANTFQQLQLPEFKIENNKLFDKVVLESDQWTWVITGETENPLLLKSDIVFKKVDMFQEGIDFLMSVESSLVSNNNNEFFTDSNGYFSMNRKLTSQLETSVFPMNLFSGVQDSQSNNSVGFLSSFSHGVTLQENRRMMIYLQRSTLEDDHKGVDQNVQVNDNFVVSNWIYFAKENFQEKVLPKLHQIVNFEPLIYYAKTTKQNLLKKKLEQVNESVRVNVDFDGQGHVIVKMQNLELQNKITVNCQEIFQSYFNDLTFKEFNIAAFFNSNKSDNNDVNLNLESVEFEPLEFKFFQADLPYKLMNQYKVIETEEN